MLYIVENSDAKTKCTFFENTIGWHLVYEYDTYSLYWSSISVYFCANWTDMKRTWNKMMSTFVYIY